MLYAAAFFGSVIDDGAGMLYNMDIVTEGLPMSKNSAKETMLSLAGENRVLTDGFDAACAVRCHNGVFVGQQNGDTLSFKGIPYAAQPVGERRWRAPEKAPASDTVYEARYFGHSSIQTELHSERASYYPQGEDCLNLNIWLNTADNSRQKPVMVFFHGGSYGWGGTSDPLYEGTNLVAKFPDIIVVTVAYRTGIMGFIDFSAVDGGDAYRDSGNLGLLDQVCALRWLHDNIGAFGGDSANITIWGESAGAGSVSLLPLIADAKGLFARVIAQSGTVAFTSSREECALLTDKLMKASGCRTMQQLVALSTNTLMQLNKELNDYNNFPERDGVVLPLDPYAAYENGDVADIPMLLGTNRDECRYWINEAEGMVPLLDSKTTYKYIIHIQYENDRKRFSDQEKAAIKRFLSAQKGKRYLAVTELYNELTFRLPAVRQAQANARRGGTVYLYYWDYPSAIDFLGACHAVELSSVFNNLDDTIYTGKPSDPDLADTVQRMWVNFARCGDPSIEEHPWEPYTDQTKVTMVLGKRIRPIGDLFSGRRKLLLPLTDHYLHGSYVTMSFNVPTVYKAVLRLVARLGVAAAIVALPISAVIKRRRSPG